MLVKKRVETHNGLFIIGATILNEDGNGKPIASDNDFVLRFLPKGRRGVICGKKHFLSVDSAELYVQLLDLNGFSVMDL